jgi:hypothetical protein
MGRFAYDPNLGLCRPFIWGGCGGNGNNYETPEDCYAACGGLAERDPARCASPTECALMPNLCCGPCDEPNLTNMVAVRKTEVNAVFQAMSCHLVDCPTCLPIANPWLGAACRANRCVSFDARQTELVSCTADTDCVLRAGVGCCADCSASGYSAFVALNREADIRPFTCGSEPVGCDDCAPVPPPDLIAVCASGSCTTAILAID